MSGEKAALPYLAALLEARTGQQIAPSRLGRVGAVLKGIMKQRGIDDLGGLATAIAAGRDVTLAGEVVEALLNNETFFFRDAPAFQQLRHGALPALRQRRETTKQIRIWSAGCSTGQEAYSLAMIFANDRALWRGWNIEITATDVSEAALSKARAGYYSPFEIQRGLPVGSMLKWFDQVGEDWRVKRELAGHVRFRRHNLLMAQTGRFDLILCRNVLLYFSPARRVEAFERLAASMASDGYLMLGAGETAAGHTDAFTSVPELRGLFRVAAPPKRAVA